MRHSAILKRQDRIATRSGARHEPGRQAQLRRLAVLYTAPVVLLLLVLIAYPLLRVVWECVRYVNLVNPTVRGFAGLDNFRTVLQDDDFLPALRNTMIWTALSVAGEYVLGLASALALARNVPGRGIFRALIIVPWVIPIVVAGLTWSWMLTPEYGILNHWLVQLGIIRQPIAWLGQPSTALFTVTLVNIWRSFPFYTISLLAALQAVPRELHEAAAVDGAGTLMRFRVITMPHIRTVSLTLILIHVIWTAINFDFIWVMTQGGPLDASETLPIMIYRYAMQQFDVGAACALASMMMGFMASIVFVQYYAARARRPA
ncbi:carbohydrate ABC transporter permease [Lichenicoccus roseus]|uniref:Sugar ABC transporter permease n=1 Tax=Lichenicoccus roseus TaxID=2683649 RepID=A0A5R9JD34_9PROT|nr:sugar ABC transporter permease [Lichenicoccus roseus]TLU73521.1 sugar ABC transporter permease [Lichenicoccus roseus]